MTDYQHLKQYFKRHQQSIIKGFYQTHGHFKKLLKKHRFNLQEFKQMGTKAIAGATMAGALFISPVTAHNQIKTNAPPGQAKPSIPSASSVHQVLGPEIPAPPKLTESQFVDQLKNILGQNLPMQGNLTDDQLSAIKKMVEQQWGISVSPATNSGFQLRDEFGYMGAEQHLPTHPGDTAEQHVSANDPLATLSGLTPKTGAWGYVPAGPEEEWYVAAQTFLSDQFASGGAKNLAGQRYLVIQVPKASNNYHTAVVVGDIRDSGPGVYTGKVFGGSPEFFYLFGAAAGSSRKTQVIMLPITNNIPTNQLGPKGF